KAAAKKTTSTRKVGSGPGSLKCLMEPGTGERTSEVMAKITADDHGAYKAPEAPPLGGGTGRRALCLLSSGEGGPPSAAHGTCNRCSWEVGHHGRPQKVCLCPFLPAHPLTVSTSLYIVQHPAEESRVLRTVPLLAACLPEDKCKVLIGRRFGEESCVTYIAFLFLY
ncbi:DTW domain-containing 2, partial [Pelobates cultripes]